MSASMKDICPHHCML